MPAFEAEQQLLCLVLDSKVVDDQSRPAMWPAMRLSISGGVTWPEVHIDSKHSEPAIQTT